MITVVSNENMRKSDEYTIAHNTPSKELMYRAGKAIYDLNLWDGKVAIVCGTGNNAGDGYVLAKLLNENGIPCTIFLIENKFSSDGLYYFNMCLNNYVEIKMIDKNTDFSSYDIIVDAIFGTGFKNEIPDYILNTINLINESKKKVIAIDINSGLNGDSGLTNYCVHSSLTISIGNFKTGHFLNMAKDVMKEKVNCDIGINIINKPYYLIEASDLKMIFQDRLNYSNKSTYSYICLMGGSRQYNGAIRMSMCAYSAMRSGAGVVNVCVPESLVNLISERNMEATITSLKEVDGHMAYDESIMNTIIKKNKVIAFGMGITNNNDTKLCLNFLLKNYKGVLIIDADGLNALSEMDENTLFNRKCEVILTPHMMEFSRLTHKSITEINQNPIQEALEYAKKYDITLLLKGPCTIIANKDDVYLVDRGCAGMATAGSGDVLSGVLAAVVGYNLNNILLATAAGAYINGLAGELAQREYGDISMIARDTINNLHKAIISIKNSK